MSDGARRPAFVWSGATTLILTGATAAWMYLGSIASLWSSAYGRMLSAKLLLFIGVASCGYRIGAIYTRRHRPERLIEGWTLT